MSYTVQNDEKVIYVFFQHYWRECHCGRSLYLMEPVEKYMRTTEYYGMLLDIHSLETCHGFLTARHQAIAWTSKHRSGQGKQA